MVAGFVVAFVGSVALWWVYFAHHAEEGLRRIREAFDPARMGRAAYAYGHAVMVAGVIVAAVADELVIAHPGGDLEAATAWAILGGPALYLAGNALFNWALTGRVPTSRLGAIAALALLGVLAPVLTPLGLAAAATGVVVALAGLDALGWRGGAAPSLAER